MDFDTWFENNDWWKEDDARVVFEQHWDVLRENSDWHADDIADMFDDLVRVMRNEYGD